MKDRPLEIIKGVKYYKGNKVVGFLLDMSKHIDLNSIWKLYSSDFFSLEDLKEFYQLIGYSEQGYEDIFEDKEDLDNGI